LLILRLVFLALDSRLEKSNGRSRESELKRPLQILENKSYLPKFVFFTYVGIRKGGMWMR
jgi:hypothetical protein